MNLKPAEIEYLKETMKMQNDLHKKIDQYYIKNTWKKVWAGGGWKNENENSKFLQKKKRSKRDVKKRKDKT